MDEAKRKRLEAAGWKVGDVDEFLLDVFGPGEDESGDTESPEESAGPCPSRSGDSGVGSQEP